MIFDDMKTSIYFILFLIIALISSHLIQAQARIDIESGLVATGYNNVRIPGDQGTDFSMKDDLVPETSFFYRLSAGYTINSRHTISVLYAPLEIKSEGSVPFDLFFEGKEFSSDTDLEGTYMFNSYRLTYRYELVKKPGLEFGFGFTAKIRDAKIAISSPTEYSEKPMLVLYPSLTSGYCITLVIKLEYSSMVTHWLHLREERRMC